MCPPFNLSVYILRTALCPSNLKGNDGSYELLRSYSLSVVTSLSIVSEVGMDSLAGNVCAFDQFIEVVFCQLCAEGATLQVEGAPRQLLCPRVSRTLTWVSWDVAIPAISSYKSVIKSSRSASG